MSHRTLFLDSVHSPVDSFLENLVQTNPRLQLDRKHRLILRSNIKSWGKVALLSGGGSGHEPSHAGFVGQGMLSAAVAGDIFASPPVESILAALRQIDGPAGTIVIVKNYTGDRLNFGLAIEQFCAESPKSVVEMVLVADDYATKDVPARSRGLCGTLLYHKVLGAMAEKGCNIRDLLNAAELLRFNIVTLSVSVGHCQVPGNAPIDFPKDKYEVGLGIHNEPGVGQKSLEPFPVIINNVVKPLFEVLPVHSSKKYIILVNSLGGLSSLEIGNIANEVLHWSSVNGFEISAMVTGSLMTSLDMPGFSITLANLPHELQRYLVEPTECHAWPGVNQMNNDPFLSQLVEHAEEVLPEENHATVTEKFQILLKKVVMNSCSAIIGSEGLLNQLDGISGDGDCGTSLSRLATKIKEMHTDLKYDCPRKLFYQLSKIAEKVGGTSGALYGILFGSLAQGLIDPGNVRCWGHAFDKAVQKLVVYSGASFGQKSMLDVLGPLRENLLVIPEDVNFDELKQHMQLANVKCKTAAEATSHMKALVGRSSYSSDRSDVSGRDPGAVAVCIWVNEIAESIQNFGRD